MTSTWRRAIVPSVRAPPARKIYICMLFALSREGRCRVVKALCALSTAHPPRFLWKQGTVGSGTPSQRRGPRLCGDAGRSQHSISAQATETRSGVAARGCPHHAHRNRSSRRHTGQNRTAHSGTPARPHCSRRSGSPRPLRRDLSSWLAAANAVRRRGSFGPIPPYRHSGGRKPHRFSGQERNRSSIAMLLCCARCIWRIGYVPAARH